jgi:hypothetical protein
LGQFACGRRIALARGCLCSGLQILGNLLRHLLILTWVRLLSCGSVLNNSLNGERLPLSNCCVEDDTLLDWLGDKPTIFTLSRVSIADSSLKVDLEG